VTVSVSGPQRRLFLLTGATGYVGGRLLRVLEQRGERVRCLTGASRPSPLTRLDDDRERLQLALFIARFDAPVATAQ
jgi:nucleoside-diphosphate-sugar epimerase